MLVWSSSVRNCLKSQLMILVEGNLYKIFLVTENDEMARVALCDNPSWAPLTVLLGLVSCSVPIPLKAELLLTLGALAKSPDTAATLWHNLEASQILTTVPSTSSYQPRGIQVRNLCSGRLLVLCSVG